MNFFLNMQDYPMSLISLSTWSFFWAGLVKGAILSLFYYEHFLTDKLLHEHVGLPHVLDLAVHLVNFFGWMSQGGHSEQLLFFALFYQSTPSCLKVGGGVGGVSRSWGCQGLGFWPCALVNRSMDLGQILEVWKSLDVLRE